MIEIRVPGEEDIDRSARLDGRTFGHAWEADDLASERTIMDLDRFRVAVDGAAVIGVAGSFGLEMTLPGGATVPTGGVTWVGVEQTHRRRGVMSALMLAVHADIDERGEPLAALTASEGGIYERFGYGVASWRRATSLDRRRAQIAERFRPAVPGVRIIEHDDPALPDELARRWDRVRRCRAGEIQRTPAWHRRLIQRRGAGVTWALHDDGFACWTVEQRWNVGHPEHEAQVLDLAAATPDAHVALWHTLLSLDLVGLVTSIVVAPDDPLPFLLTDPRALRTTELNDFLWLDVRGIAACFAARTYATDDELVVDCDGARWSIGGGGCRRVRRRADLVAERSAMGPLLLGGVAPSTLVAGRRLTARSPEVLRRADALLVTYPGPHGTTGF